MAHDAQDDLRITDEFDFEVFWAKHGNQITGVFVAAVAIVLILLYWQHQTSSRAEEAATRLQRAMDVPALEQVVRDFPGSPSAGDALMRLGDLYYRNGQYTEAASTYQRLIKDFSTYPLADSGKLGLATILEAQGNFDGARAQYVQIVNSNPGSYVANSAKMGLARCLEALGQKKEARQIYEEMLALGQNSPWFGQAYLRWVVLTRDAQPQKVEETAAKPGAALSGGNMQFPLPPKSP
jgi:tetratricopeptide (TPR) repeat protein